MEKYFDIAYEATAQCVVRVRALDEKSAMQMVQTCEAGNVAEDCLSYDRKVIGIISTVTAPDFLTNRDTGDEDVNAL